MNIAGILAIFGYAAVGAFVGILLKARGIDGRAALLSGVASTAILASLHGVLWRTWRRRQPLFPLCRNGKCDASGYVLVATENGEATLRCQCGDTYRAIRDARTDTRRFMRVRSDGSLEPYMLCRGWRPWETDRGS
jgi:hypothetical protein